MPKKIQNLSINVQDLMKLSPSQKIEIFQSTAGARIVSQLTPEQYASIFPRFFLDRMRYDVSGFMSALSPEARDRLRDVLPSGTAESSTGAAGARQRQPTATAPSIKNSVPTWMKELEKVAPGASDAKAKATFSPDQQKVLDELRKGQVSADDPRLSFINKLSPEDRQRAGIQTVEQDGKQAFTIPQQKVTREEVEEEHKKTGKLQGGSFSQQSPIVMNRLMKDFNLTKEQAAGIVGNLGHESSGLQAGIQEKRPISGRGGLGWAQWTGPRRVAFERFLEETGQSANDPEANYAFLRKELQTTENRALNNLRKAQTVEEATHVFDRDYERSGIKHMGSRLNYARQSMGLYNPDAGTGGQGAPLTEEEAAKIEQRILSRRREESERIIAGGIERPQLPEGIDPKFVEQYNKMPVGQAQKVAEAISKMGAENFNEAFKKEPDKVLADTRVRQDGISPPPNAPGTEGEIVAEENFSRRRNRPVDRGLKYKIEEAVRSVYGPGYKVQIYSGGEDPNNKVSQSGRHDKGKAADIYITDPNGNRVSREDQLALAQFWKHKGYGGIGLGMADGGMHLDIARQGQWGYAGGQEGRTAFLTEREKQALEEVSRNNFDVNKIMKDSSYYDFSKKVESVIAEGRQAGKEVSYAEAAEMIRKQVETKKAEARASESNKTTVTPAAPSPVGTPQEPFVAPSPAGADSRSTATAQPPRTTPAVPAQLGTPQEAFTAPKPASQARPAVLSTQQEASDDTIYVPAFSEGGNEEVKKTDKVEAYSIDHDNRNASLKGDDAVVVDAKSRDPLFTMNTTRETAVFDPATQSISVTPVDQSSDNESKPKSFVSVAKPDALSVPIFSMDTNDGTAKKYDPSTKNVNKSGTSDVKMKNNQKNSSSHISKANVYVKDKENLDNFVPVLAEGGEVDMSTDQTNNQPTDNKNVSVSNMGSMQTSAAQSVPNPTVAFSMAANPSFECPSFVRACGAVNGQRSTDPFGGHYDKFASNLA